MPLFHVPQIVSNARILKDMQAKFMEQSQALLHGDLHTGSILVTPESTQVPAPKGRAKQTLQQLYVCAEIVVTYLHRTQLYIHPTAGMQFHVLRLMVGRPSIRAGDRLRVRLLRANGLRHRQVHRKSAAGILCGGRACHARAIQVTHGNHAPCIHWFH